MSRNARHGGKEVQRGAGQARAQEAAGRLVEGARARRAASLSASQRLPARAPCRRGDAPPVGVMAKDGALGQAGAHDALGHLPGGRGGGGRRAAERRFCWAAASTALQVSILLGPRPCPGPAPAITPRSPHLVGRRLVLRAQHLALNQHRGALAVPGNRLGQTLREAGGAGEGCRAGR